MLQSFILSTWIYLLLIPLTGIQIPRRVVYILQIYANTNNLLSFPLGRHIESNFLSLVSWPLLSFTSISFCFRIHTFSLGYDHYSPFPFGTSSPLPFLMIVPPLQNSLEWFKCPLMPKERAPGFLTGLYRCGREGRRGRWGLKSINSQTWTKWKRVLRTDHVLSFFVATILLTTTLNSL